MNTSIDDLKGSKWETVPLGDLASFVMGQAPPGSASNFEGIGEVFVKAGEFGPERPEIREWTTQPLKYATEGDVLICVVGATAGKLNLGIDCAIGRSVAAIQPSSAIHQKYLFYQLLQHVETFRSGSTGSAQGVISKKQLAEFKIKLAPQHEQRRITDKLDTTLAAVEACKQKLNSAAETIQRFRQSVLAAAVSGELTRAWREERKTRIDQANNEIAELIEVRITNNGRRKAKLPVEPDTSNWSTELPETWALASVSMFAECLDSQRIPVKKEKRLTATGIYPYYGANGIVDKVDEYIFDDELVLVTEDETFYGRTKPIAYRSSGKCWVNNHAHVLRPQDKISANYLCYALMHYPVIPWLTGTTGRAKLTQAVLNALPIGVPPREEMEYIVNKVQILLHQADELDSRFKAALESLAQLQPSILAKAFRGELVPQDPSDEPASVLLQRIKDQREAEAAAKKPAKRGKKKKADPAQLVIPEGIADNHLAKMLEECGALSELALLAASELEPNVFKLQLRKETKEALIMQNAEGVYESTNTQTNKEENYS